MSNKNYPGNESFTITLTSILKSAHDEKNYRLLKSANH